MSILALNRALKEYTGSIFFQITVAVLAVLTWMMPGNLPWIFVALEILLSFFPLFSSDGRAYMPLLLFMNITVSTSISFRSVPTYLYVLAGVTLFSILLFLAIKRMPLKKGALSLPLLFLFLSFLISYIVHFVMGNSFDATGLLFLTSLFLVVLCYILFNTCLKREDTILYFARTASVLAIAIAAEILLYQVRHGFSIGDPTFNLGWAYTSQTASTILCLSLPFFGMLIARKRFAWVFWEAFVLYGIITLSTDSGLIALLFSIVPLILLSFRTYGKAYPYLSLGILTVLGLALVLLMLFNEAFRERVGMALANLNLLEGGNPQRHELFDKGLESFMAFPSLGSSISVLSQTESGTIVFCSNTIISTMAMGGIVGLIFFILYEVFLYVTVLRKKAKEKWLFLVLLLVVEVIGLIDNTLYNLFILLYILLAYSCYQISDRPDEVVVHESYYRDYPFERTIPYDSY